MWAEDTSCWGSLAASLLTDVVEEYAGRPLVLFSLRPHSSGQVRNDHLRVLYLFEVFVGQGLSSLRAKWPWEPVSLPACTWHAVQGLGTPSVTTCKV